MIENDGVLTAPRMALALSGGGSRAMAFHLGCLKALDKLGYLDRVSVISAVSGGSVLAALYCSTPGNFAQFEKKTREALERGFVYPALRVALTTREGLAAITTACALGVDRTAAFVAKKLKNLLGVAIGSDEQWLRESPIRRTHSRTTILQRVFDELFEYQTLAALRPDRPKLIVVACELRTKSAFYFASDKIGTWRHGSAEPQQITLAHAVTASASYPAFLPALDEDIVFTKDGVQARHRVMLTDGGVYDNLGLAPLWPDRDPAISLHVNHFDQIVACRAGYALEESPSTAFWPSRMNAVFEAIHARAQNLAMGRLFDLGKSRAIKGFIIPYLGQNDARLTNPPANFVSRQEVANYPTDFSAMPKEWIERLALRGEQLVEALIEEHWAKPQA